MKKLYRKSELGFALCLIGAYCVLMSVGDGLSRFLGIEKLVTLPVAAALSVALLFFIGRNGLWKKYGLCRAEVRSAQALYYVPLLLLLTVNLWNGAGLHLSAAETVTYILTMLCVGFLEEVIFRGFLFNAMKKDSLRTAVIISSVTFGFGHIINLFNTSGAELVPNLLQVLYATAAGFMLVMLYLYSESLIACIVFHGLFNALSVFSAPQTASVGEEVLSCAFLVAVSLGYGLVLLKKRRRAEEKHEKE